MNEELKLRLIDTAILAEQEDNFALSTLLMASLVELKRLNDEVNRFNYAIKKGELSWNT